VSRGNNVGKTPLSSPDQAPYPPAHSNLQSSGGGDESAAKLSAALLSRLHLRKLLYQATTKMRHRTKQDLDAAHRFLQRAVGELAAARASAGLGALQPRAGGGAEGDDDEAGWLELGFDRGLNSHLAPPAPPRVVKVRLAFVGWVRALIRAPSCVGALLL